MLAVPSAPTFSQKGFSLTEMAVVLVIVALLVGGMLLPISAQQNQRYTAETESQMKLALDSVMGFAVIKNRLPCPANPSLETGVEDCSRMQGTLPWADLGINRTDAWGRKFSYRVTDAFKSSFLVNTSGDITIKDGSGTPIATQIPAIIVSHGINGLGAYVPGVSTPLPAGTGDELENSDTNAVFVSKTPDPNFDDLVAWIPPTVLINRMISAGKLP